MDRIDVISSNLSSVGYDELTSVLEIAFHSGGIYQYFDVPATTHANLLGAASKGTYFDQNIKSRFRFKKIK